MPQIRGWRVAVPRATLGGLAARAIDSELGDLYCPRKQVTHACNTAYAPTPFPAGRCGSQVSHCRSSKCAHSFNSAEIQSWRWAMSFCRLSLMVGLFLLGATVYRA